MSNPTRKDPPRFPDGAGVGRSNDSSSAPEAKATSGDRGWDGGSVLIPLRTAGIVVSATATILGVVCTLTGFVYHLVERTEDHVVKLLTEQAKQGEEIRSLKEDLTTNEGKPLTRCPLAHGSLPVTMRQRCQQRTEGSSRSSSNQQVSTCWAQC